MRTTEISILAGVLALNILVAYGTPKGVNPSVRMAVIRNYIGIDAAFHSKNVDQLFTYLMPNYVVYEKGEVISAAVNRQNQAQWFATSEFVTSQSDVQKMTMQNGKVVAAITQYVTYKVPDTASGKIETDGYFFHEQDFWVRTPSGWRIQATRVLSEVDTVNGHPITKATAPDLS